MDFDPLSRGRKIFFILAKATPEVAGNADIKESDYDITLA